MKNNEIIQQIINSLNNLPNRHDLSDIGNSIGLVIKDHLSDELGFESNDFYNGLKHGLKFDEHLKHTPTPTMSQVENSVSNTVKNIDDFDVMFNWLIGGVNNSIKLDCFKSSDHKHEIVIEKGVSGTVSIGVLMHYAGKEPELLYMKSDNHELIRGFIKMLYTSDSDIDVMTNEMLGKLLIDTVRLLIDGEHDFILIDLLTTYINILVTNGREDESVINLNDIQVLSDNGIKIHDHVFIPHSKNKHILFELINQRLLVAD